MAPTSTIERKTYSIAEFIEMSGLSESTTFKLLASGELASVRVGARRLILARSIDALLDPDSAPHSPADSAGA